MKKKGRRILAVLLAGMMLAACQEKAEVPETKDTAAVSAETVETAKTGGICPGNGSGYAAG